MGYGVMWFHEKLEHRVMAPTDFRLLMKLRLPQRQRG